MEHTIRLTPGHQAVVTGQAVFPQRIVIALQAILCIRNGVRGADKSDVRMALLNKMPGGEPGAIAIVKRNTA